MANEVEWDEANRVACEGMMEALKLLLTHFGKDQRVFDFLVANSKERFPEWTGQGIVAGLDVTNADHKIAVQLVVRMSSAPHIVRAQVEELVEHPEFEANASEETRAALEGCRAPVVKH